MSRALARARAEARALAVRLRLLRPRDERPAGALAHRRAVLEGLPLARGVSPAVLDRLAAAAQVSVLPPGVDVVVQGALTHAFYVVIEGQVVVHDDGAAIVRLGPGEVFGERGLLDAARRNATVTTETESRILRVEGPALMGALADDSALREALGAGDPQESVTAQARPDALRGATIVVVSAGYPGKRRIYERLSELGVSLVIVDEPRHWSERLVAEGLAARWLPASVTGDPDTDAAAVLDALQAAKVRADGVLTFYADSVGVAARVATALGLPTNPPAAVDAARSKVRTREVSAELGLPSPRAKRVRSLDELYAAAEHVGFPAVVKPEFGAAAIGCVRVDGAEDLPRIYGLVRDVVHPGSDAIFRTGNDLLLEEYLDGVEFDVDLILEGGEMVFASVSQNWPTAEPSFQETGLHCPPDHKPREVRRLVAFTAKAVKAFGFERGVLHVEGKYTSSGPRIVEVNARMGGARLHQIVEAVWGVDPIEAHARACHRIRARIANRSAQWSTSSSTRRPAAGSRRCRSRRSHRTGRSGSRSMWRPKSASR